MWSRHSGAHLRTAASAAWTLGLLFLLLSPALVPYVGRYIGFSFNPSIITPNLLDLHTDLILSVAEAAVLGWLGSAIAAILRWRSRRYARWLARRGPSTVLLYRTLYNALIWFTVSFFYVVIKQPADLSLLQFLRKGLGGLPFYVLLVGTFSGASWFIAPPPPEPPLTLLSRQDLQAIVALGQAEEAPASEPEHEPGSDSADSPRNT